MYMNKKCVICGFVKRVHEHHLQKHNDFGKDSEDNLVFLCPNHHWLADFGTTTDRFLLLSKIKKITRKTPQIDYDKQEYYDKLIRAYEENNLFKRRKPDNEEWEEFKNSFNYKFNKKLLLSRTELTASEQFRNECEVYYLIKLLNEELENVQKAGR